MRSLCPVELGFVQRNITRRVHDIGYSGQRTASLLISLAKTANRAQYCCYKSGSSSKTVSYRACREMWSPEQSDLYIVTRKLTGEGSPLLPSLSCFVNGETQGTCHFPISLTTLQLPRLVPPRTSPPPKPTLLTLRPSLNLVPHTRSSDLETILTSPRCFTLN
jgi:hypothetical protein